MECLVTVEVEPRPFEPAFPEDALMRATAKAVAVDEEGDPQLEQVYGTLQWRHVGYGAALNGGCPGWEVADLEADLLSLHEVLFDEEDRLRDATADHSDIRGLVTA